MSEYIVRMDRAIKALGNNMPEHIAAELTSAWNDVKQNLISKDNPEDKPFLSALATKVKAMRDRQTMFFKHHSNVDLNESKRLEKEVDEYLAFLSKHINGSGPTRTQSSMF